MASVIMSGNVGVVGQRNHPISDGASGDRVVGRAAFGGVQRLNQAFVETGFFVWSQKSCDLDLVAPRDQVEMLDAKILIDLHVEPDPERIEGEFGDLAAMAD